MAEAKEVKPQLLAVRALMPAVIVTAMAWFANLFEVRDSIFNIPLLISCYLLGAAVIFYAQMGAGVKKTTGFYAAYLACALFGALLGVAVLRLPPAVLTGFMSLPLLMFALPVAFELVMERVSSVHAQ